jgi:hypothetical protein
VLVYTFDDPLATRTNCPLAYVTSDQVNEAGNVTAVHDPAPLFVLIAADVEPGATVKNVPLPPVAPYVNNPHAAVDGKVDAVQSTPARGLQ